MRPRAAVRSRGNVSGITAGEGQRAYTRRVDRGGRATTLAAALLIASVVAAGRLEVSAQLRATAGLLPELLAAPVVLLAVRFARHRTVVAAVVLVILNRVGGPEGAVTVAACVLVAGLAAVPERRLLHPAALLHVAAAAAALPLLTRFWPEVAALGWPARLASGPWPAAVAGGCCAASAIALWWRRGPFDVALPWLVVAAAAARLGPDVLAAQRPLVLGAAQALLVVTMAETGHLLAFTDRLTALPNRRAFDDDLRRLRGRYAVAMVDVDRFKRFNDRWGHAAGDQALRLVASALAAVTGGGRAYRYGGEEFAVLFPGRAARDVAEPLELVRRAVSDRGFVVRSPIRPEKRPRRRTPSVGRRVPLTISIGAASPNAVRRTPDDVLRVADRALYRAKRAGRNCVVVG